MEKLESKFMNKYTDEEIFLSFLDAWKDGDSDDIKSSIYAIITRFGGTFVSTRTGIPRTTLYDMCKDSSNPTLENLCKILEFVKLKEIA